MKIRNSFLSASGHAIFYTLLVLCTGSIRMVNGQQPAAIAPPPASGVERTSDVTRTATSDDRYRIGPGDVLDIRVFNRPQFSRDAIRVDGRGMIRMPFIEDDLMAACHTEGELAKEIATRYLKYQRNPQVDVFIKEYASQPVAVIGAVNAPGRFQLQRRVRLLELLAFAGGPNIERSGLNVQVAHAEMASVCGEPVENNSDLGLTMYSLRDTLRGEEKANPYVRPGDIVTLPEAEQVYVVGNVIKPSSIAIKEQLTVTRAIAMAGGTMPDTKSNRVRIIRQLPGSTTKTEIYVDLKAINSRQAEDVVLQANDIVDVPTSGGKRLLRSIFSSIVPSAASLPIQVIR
ncbi:MAG TPA: polysaccharide biosynthesis/export family protein [Pyrinomonadaceae bacterium]|jgi:polysaccharide export outer membrane protein|nr:polysaccharide biosynthesis/export family protein [Pyrinomonadaceae bacterium]